MAVSLGIVVVPSCMSPSISEYRLYRPIFPTPSIQCRNRRNWGSATPSIQCRNPSCRVFNVGTGVIWARRRRQIGGFSITSCISSDSSSSSSGPKTKLFVSGLSFRTTEDKLRDTFEQYGKLVHMTLVMDKVANRPKGFAFLRYETEEEAIKAIEGMHGKFLDGRVIFVEEAKPRSDIPRSKPRPDFPRAQSKPRTFRTW